jgi:hypothetical protein
MRTLKTGLEAMEGRPIPFKVFSIFTGQPPSAEVIHGDQRRFCLGWRAVAWAVDVTDVEELVATGIVYIGILGAFSVSVPPRISSLPLRCFNMFASPKLAIRVS